MERVPLDHQFWLCKCIKSVYVKRSSAAAGANLVFLATIDNVQGLKCSRDSPWRTFPKSCSLTEACFEQTHPYVELAGYLEHSSLTTSMCQVRPILTEPGIGGLMLAQSLRPDVVLQMESENHTDKVFTGRRDDLTRWLPCVCTKCNIYTPCFH